MNYDEMIILKNTCQCFKSSSFKQYYIHKHLLLWSALLKMFRFYGNVLYMNNLPISMRMCICISMHVASLYLVLLDDGSAKLTCVGEHTV